MPNADIPTVKSPPMVPPIIVLRERLQAREAELKAALPPDIPVATFIRAAITAAQINPDIQTCEFSSLWNALLQGCRDGLLPDGKEGAIVPYKQKATWIPMYLGLLRRFRRSGQFKWVKADLVRQGDTFSHYTTQEGEFLHHASCYDFAAPIMKIYACATTKDGGSFITVLTIAEANKIKGMSRASREDAPWKLWAEEMYKKTALRRLSKILPTERDFMPDEDIPDASAPLLVPASSEASSIPDHLPPRASGPAAALEQFAGQPHAAGALDVAVADGGAATDDRAPDSSADRPRKKD